MSSSGTATCLRDLELVDFQVSYETPADNVLRRLQDDSQLCGVVVLHERQVLGMLSRQVLLEWKMNKPSGLEVFLKRPIDHMLEFLGREFIVLSGETSVTEAATTAFRRGESTIFDPIVVELSKNDYRLLDIPVLLLAQAQVQQEIQTMIEEQQGQLKKMLIALEQERNRSLRYAQDLERQKSEILAQNLALSAERQAAQARSEELTQLNARILEISRVLSEKVQSTFSSTFEGVEAVRQSTAKITQSSQDLTCEMGEIQTIVDTINEIAGQIRILSFNAAVEANRSGGNSGGLGAIAQEIRRLATSTTEASRRIGQLAEGIQLMSREMMNSAQDSGEVVQQLSLKAQNAQDALSQLESLLEDLQDPGIG
jgi:methyl-accepting chemotaxis protein